MMSFFLRNALLVALIVTAYELEKLDRYWENNSGILLSSYVS